MLEEATLSDPQADNHRLVQLMERAHLEESFGGDPSDRLQRLHELTFDQFEHLLTTANGICRDIAPRDRVMDGSGHIIEISNYSGESRMTYVPPAEADRAPLMREAFEAAKRTDNVDRVATMLGMVINDIHPYNDGNGRTSRLVYSLLSRGYNGSPEDQAYYNELLQNTSGRAIVDLNSQMQRIPDRFAVTYSGRLARAMESECPVPTRSHGGYNAEYLEDYQPEALTVDDSVSAAGRADLHQVLSDRPISTAVLFDFLLTERPDPGQYINHGAGGAFVALDRLVPTLSDGDIEKLRGLQDSIKRRYVETIIQIFTDPEDAALADELVEAYRPKLTDSEL